MAEGRQQEQLNGLMLAATPRCSRRLPRILVIIALLAVLNIGLVGQHFVAWVSSASFDRDEFYMPVKLVWVADHEMGFATSTRAGQRTMAPGLHFSYEEIVGLYDASEGHVSLEQQPVWARDKAGRRFALPLAASYRMAPEQLPHVMPFADMARAVRLVSDMVLTKTLAQYQLDTDLPQQRQALCQQLKQQMSAALLRKGYQLTEVVFGRLQPLDAGQGAALDAPGSC